MALGEVGQGMEKGGGGGGGEREKLTGLWHS